MKIRFISLLLTLLLASVSQAEVLHKWSEPSPDHSYTYGNTVEDLFYTYTTKDASRSESGGSWSLTASATASANAQAPLPRGGDLSTQFDVDAQLRATGDLDTLKTDPPDGLPKTEQGVEQTKTSSDGTTTARRRRVVHVVSYQNNVDGKTDQRTLSASTSGGKSETSVSPTDLDADPWAKSWLEVKRRINLNKDVPGSPFKSETPDCSSSGNGHTCDGAKPPPKKREVVYCRRGDACGNKPGVKGNRDAHVIKCPNQTYKQGLWSWLMLKLKEDCKGEKWSCHSDPDNCSRKHLHLKAASEAQSGDTVVNGLVVPSGYSVGACGEHLYASGSASEHALQASCATDTKCISTNFYLCQHTAHEYQKLLPCGHKEGSAGSHVKSYWRTCGHTDWHCLGPMRHNYNRCPKDSGGQTCTGDAKYPGWYLPCDTSHVHTYLSDQPPEPKKQVTPTTTDPKPKQVLPKDDDDDDDSDDDDNTDTNDKDVTGDCGLHTYKSSESSSQASLHVEVSFSCGVHKYYACTPPSSSEKARHDSRTLPCGNHSGRLCLASSSHTSPVSCPTKNGKDCKYGSYYTCTQHVHAYPGETTVQVQYRKCGHPTTASGDHSWVGTCSVTNSDGDTCTKTTGYWACTPHLHKYPAVDPPPSYHGCRRHLSSVSGDHSWVSSCAVTNGSGKTCTKATGYWACTPHLHDFPDDPPPPELRRCGRHYKSESGDHSWVSSCSVSNGSGKSCTKASGYFACTPHVHSFPELRRCGRHYKTEGGDHSWVSSCSVTNSNGESCTKTSGYFACTPHTHKFPELRRCGRHYKSVGGDHSWVKPCTVTNSRGDRCTKSSGYFACTPHSHRFPAAPATRPCGHSMSSSGNHSWVSRCAVTNSRGDTCTNPVSYYACRAGSIHTHTFPSAPSTFLAVCGVHQITSSEKRSHSFVSYACSSHTYSRCLPPSGSEKARHSYQTLACGNHKGYACKASSSHTTSKSCPKDSNGKSCLNGPSYYSCASHSHSYPAVKKPDPPPSSVKCGNSWRGSGACITGRVVSSSSTEHKSSACSAGHTYWTCNSTVNVSSWENKHRTRTCRRSGCSNSWQACVDGWTAPRCQAKSGSGCWAR